MNVLAAIELIVVILFGGAVIWDMIQDYRKR